jgi:hypothetical protein
MFPGNYAFTFIPSSKKNTMKLNMGKADRVIRILLALAVGYLYYIKMITGTLSTVLMIIAFIFLITGIVGSCPLYTLFGIKTRRHAH